MFFSIFRSQRITPHPEFRSYFSRLFFDSPLCGPAGCGLISETEDAGIGSAVAFLPMTYRANGRLLTARLACAFMARPAHPKAAVRIVMSLRARGQDMMFSDSASPVSAGHWNASGGVTLAVQSLDWQCDLRPVAATAGRLRLPAWLDPLALALDGLAARRRSRHRIAIPGAAVEIDAEAYAEMAPGMIAHFAVRPEWNRDEMLWLLAMAGENRSLGPLRFFSVSGAEGRSVGCFAGFFGPRGQVRLLDVLALPRHEADVVQVMYGLLRAEGAVTARGAAHPHLLTALSPLRGMRFRHRAFTCVSTRHADIRDAISRQDIYVGGLAGESWSRLMTDFY